MTTVIIQGSINEISRKTMTNIAAIELLSFIKSTVTFVVEGISLQYTDDFLVIPNTCDGRTELHILADEVSSND